MAVVAPRAAMPSTREIGPVPPACLVPGRAPPPGPRLPVCSRVLHSRSDPSWPRATRAYSPGPAFPEDPRDGMTPSTRRLCARSLRLPSARGLRDARRNPVSLPSFLLSRTTTTPLPRTPAFNDDRETKLCRRGGAAWPRPVALQAASPAVREKASYYAPSVVLPCYFAKSQVRSLLKIGF